MTPDLDNAARPGLLRRLAAIFYDSWLIAGIWLLGVIVDTFVRDEQGLGLAVSHLPLQVFLVAAPFLFFGWFWTHGGQTLGMRAWRLKLLDSHGQPVTWRQSLIRVAGAYLSSFAVGLGYLAVLVDPDKQAWHDRLSSTRLVILSK
ncbi:MAG: RDD family protein [Gammaproteobacteria bacterium]|nr:RDD family protein [Gammaproteobacteria bacterium]